MVSSPSLVVVSKAQCPRCDVVKDMLQENEVEFLVDDWTNRPKDERQSLLDAHGSKSFPLLFEYQDGATRGKFLGDWNRANAVIMDFA